MPKVILTPNLTVGKTILIEKPLAEWYPRAKRIIPGKDKYSEDTVEDIKESKILAHGMNVDKVCVGDDTKHQLLNAVLTAYNKHLGLRLSPDNILHCVAAAVSACINDHSEQLRDVFINHQGKKKLEVVANRWDELMGLMSEKIDENVKSELKLEHTFSTSGPIESFVGTITKMATFKKYFSYSFTLMCGIPFVDLTGSLDDWLNLRAKIKHVEEIFTSRGFMANWFKHLNVVVDRLIETYECKEVSQDLETFWARIVNYVPYGSGGQEYISGWIKVLMPGDEYGKFPNELPILDSKSKKPGRNEYNSIYEWKDALKEWSKLCSKAPTSVLTVDADLDDNGTNYDIVCNTGHVGFHLENDIIVPDLGYFIHGTLKK